MERIIWLILAALMLMPGVLAFEVTFPYFKDDKLSMNPGEIRNFEIILQNMAGSSDETVSIDVSSGAEIASLSKKEHFVKLGTANTLVNLKIEIPKDAAKRYNVGIAFVSDTNTLEQGFTVEVSNPVQKNNTLIIISIAFVIALIIILIILLRKRR